MSCKFSPTNTTYKNMKRKLLTLGLALLCGGAAYCDNYYVINQTGTPDYDINAALNYGTTIMSSTSGTINDKLSSAQTLPFNWSFYGQSVTSFKASDNGYITFDPTATVSVAKNTKLPDATAPNNSIFAFWTDLQLANYTSQGATRSAAITTYTYGTAPHRIYSITWANLSKIGTPGAANAYFAVLLYEGGGFNIIHVLNSAGFAATAGATNADGTQYMMVNGSPNLGSAVHNYSGQSSNTGYWFIYGTQPATDIALNYVHLPYDVAQTDVSNTINASLNNYGSTDISSMTVNYSIDGGAAVSNDLSGLFVAANGGTYAFADPNAWSAANLAAGQYHTITFWVSNVNGSPVGGDHSDDAMTRRFFVNVGNSTYKTKILMEESTGAWCGYCPDGHIIMDQAYAQYPTQVIPVSYHNSDSMAVAGGDGPNSINYTYSIGYPSAMIDRALYEDQGYWPSLNRGVWLDKVSDRLNYKSPVNLNIIDKSFDESTRKISFTVEATFSDYAAGDLRWNALIIEDKVRGKDSNVLQTSASPYYAYTQHNYYSPVFGLTPNDWDSTISSDNQYLVGYNHNHVVRSMLTGAWGQPGFDSIVVPGKTYTKTFTYTLPQEVSVSYRKNLPKPASSLRTLAAGPARNKPEDVKLVAFLSYYDNDVLHRQVLNATAAPLLGWDAGLNEIAAKNVADVQVYPNPTNSQTTVNFNLTKGTQATVTIINGLGQKVETLNNGFMQAGVNKLSFDASSFSNGVYFLNINTGSESITHRFVVVK